MTVVAKTQKDCHAAWPHHSERNARRCRLTRHLHNAGPRPVLEALIEVSNGHDLDDVLERFGAVPVEDYHAVGAAELIVPLDVIDGGAK